MAFALPLVAAAGATTGLSAGSLALAGFGSSVSLGTILSVGSAGLSALGALRGAQGARAEGAASAQAARYNAAVAANNATIAKQNSAWAADEAERVTAAKLMETRAKVGSLKTEQAASGIDLGSVSATDVRSSAAETGQLSAIDIRTKAARQAYGYEVEAQDYENQQKLYESQAGNDLAAGDIKASTTLLGGLSTAGSGYADYLNKRSF